MFWTPSLTFNTTSIKNYCTTDISRWTDHNGDLEHKNKWHHILEACLLRQIFCHNEGGCDREDQLAGWFYLKETDKEKICFTSVTQDHNNYNWEQLNSTQLNSTQHHNTQHVRSYLPMSPLQCIGSFSFQTIDSGPTSAGGIWLRCARRKPFCWVELSCSFISLNRLCTRSQMQLKTTPVQRGLNTWSVTSPSSYWIITMMKLPMYALKISNYLKILNCWKFWNHVKMEQARKLGSWNYRSLTHSLNEWLTHWQG